MPEEQRDAIKEWKNNGNQSHLKCVFRGESEKIEIYQLGFTLLELALPEASKEITIIKYKFQ
jgi:hypothetical protein